LLDNLLLARDFEETDEVEAEGKDGSGEESVAGYDCVDCELGADGFGLREGRGTWE
jgi:hypothetical protein